MQFHHKTDVSKIDGFKILHNWDNKENPIQLIYKYPNQAITSVVTDGLTFANHTPLNNIYNTNIQVQIVIIANEVDNPPSEAFTTKECRNEETTPPAPGKCLCISIHIAIVNTIAQELFTYVSIMNHDSGSHR